MYNTDNQVQNFEKMPGENKANISPEQQQELDKNASAWEDAMAEFNQASESTEEAIEAGDDSALEQAREARDDAEQTLQELTEQQGETVDNILDQQADQQVDNNLTPRLNDPTNPVAHAFDEAWRDGQGNGVSLESAYDGIRQSNSAETIASAAQQIQPEIAHITRENKNTGNATIEANEDGVSEEAAESQNLEEITEAATAVAIGAKAEAEQAVSDLNYGNENAALGVEATLADAQAQLEQLSSESQMSQNEQPGEIQAQRASEDIISQAIDMVNEASSDVSNAAEQAEERKSELEDKQEEIRRLQEEREQNQQELQDAFGDNISAMNQTNSELPNQAEIDDALKADVFNSATIANGSAESNPDFLDDKAPEQDPDDEIPRQSIFG